MNVLREVATENSRVTKNKEEPVGLVERMINNLLNSYKQKKLNKETGVKLVKLLLLQGNQENKKIARKICKKNGWNIEKITQNL